MRRRRSMLRVLAGAAALLAPAGAPVAQVPGNALFHDSHFHLTNYVQEGTAIRDYLRIMGDKVGRSTLFGIPLQQTWSYRNSGSYAPTYYLSSDAPLYYYSFTDAFIAMTYRSLTPAEQARFDPMITGFNPADMYAVAHIRRVLRAFPGVFSGLGEFTIHKEFVSSKVAGEVASLTDPALDSVLAFAGEAGLVVILHNDLDIPFASDGADPVFLPQLVALFRRHPDTRIIWAHVGLGRVVHPVQSGGATPGERPPAMFQLVERLLEDPTLRHVHFDLSWDEVAKYVVASPGALRNAATLIDRYPDRFLFGTDNVAPTEQERHLGVYRMYQPLWDALDAEASRKVRKGNYERLFDEARVRVRAWERANVR